MDGHGTGEMEAGSCTAGWERATPEMLNSAGTGLQRGGRREGCSCCSISLPLHLSAAARQRRPRAREQQLPQALLQPGPATRAVLGGGAGGSPGVEEKAGAKLCNRRAGGRNRTGLFLTLSRLCMKGGISERTRLICPMCVVLLGLMQPHLGGTRRVWRCPRAASTLQPPSPKQCY